MRTIQTSRRWYWLARPLCVYVYPDEYLRFEILDAESAKKYGIGIFCVKPDAERDELNRAEDRVFCAVCLVAMFIAVAAVTAVWFASSQ